MEENKLYSDRVYSLFLVQTLITSSSVILLYLKLFSEITDTTFFYLTLGLTISTVPVLKFILMSIFFNILKNSIKIQNLFRTIILVSVLINLATVSLLFLLLTLTNEIITKKTDLVAIIIILSTIFEIGITFAMNPFFVDIIGVRKEISKQILISSVAFTASSLSIIIIMGVLPYFSSIEKIGFSIVSGIIIFISLNKFYNIIYHDFDIISDTIKLNINKGQKENIISEEFYSIHINLEKVIANQYSSSTSLIKIIRQFQKNIENMQKNLSELVPILDEIPKKANKLLTILENDINTIKSTLSSKKLIENSIEKISSDLKLLISNLSNLKESTTSTIPSVNVISLEISENLKNIDSLSKNINKTIEMLKSSSKNVPEILERYLSFNSIVSEIMKTTTKINSLRISFDVELKKVEFDKQNKDKFIVISQKIDKLFLELHSTVTSMYIDEEKILIDKDIKTMISEMNEISKSVKKLYSIVQKLNEDININLRILEETKSYPSSIIEQSETILNSLNEIQNGIYKEEKELKDSIKSMEYLKQYLVNIIEDYNDLKNELKKHIKYLESIDIILPKFIEDIYEV
ncbi:MAG: hypothetical protein N2712_07610 [Brevinematales bacterium]|nr:hypothetical protein [Brevinematales bacterium]